MGRDTERVKLLIAEDDDGIREGLRFALEQEGYETVACATVQEAAAVLEGEGADLCLLDVTLPDGSGYQLCRLARQEGRELPVIFLTACDAEVSVIMGLDMGADDYITKPFRVRELTSRIRSVLRRCKKEGTASGQTSGVQSLCLGDIVIRLEEARVFRREEEVLLTALEYRLLLTFAKHRGQVLSRNQLLESIWDVAGDFVSDNTVSVYIKRLREKLGDDPREPQIIQTVRGFGYRTGI